VSADPELLPPYDGIRLADVRLVRTPLDAAAALAALSQADVIGFDTESKPTFNKGEVSGGPDVVQFATASTAYVLQLRHAASLDLVRQVLAERRVIKVGFGLAQDQQQLRQRLGACAQPLLDLDVVFRRQGYQRTIGIKSAVAILFNQRFIKSKRITTSNWAQHPLEPRQLLYAANDAWVALQVLHALGLDEHQLPVWADGVPPPTEAAPGRPAAGRNPGQPAAGAGAGAGGHADSGTDAVQTPARRPRRRRRPRGATPPGPL
jgi:ribonuclease D